MKTVSPLHVSLRLAMAVLVALFAFAQGMSRMLSVEPGKGKAGDELTVTGENLDKKSVVEIYLTSGNTDIKLPVTAQSETQIKFRIPAEAKPGRYSLMLLTSGAAPKLVEQPVKVTVE